MDRIQSIHILFVTQAEQRYATLGDWQFVPELSLLRIRVTQMPNQHMSWPIALHELAEALLCHARGLTTAQVDAWDIHGPGKDLHEPGDDPRAPYHTEHMAADDLEIQFAQALGFTADEYADYIDTQENPDDSQ